MICVLRVLQDAAVSLMSLLPAIKKRSAPRSIVSDESALVEELSALKKKSDWNLRVKRTSQENI